MRGIDQNEWNTMIRLWGNLLGDKWAPLNAYIREGRSKLQIIFICREDHWNGWPRVFNAKGQKKSIEMDLEVFKRHVADDAEMAKRETESRQKKQTEDQVQYNKAISVIDGLNNDEAFKSLASGLYYTSDECIMTWEQGYLTSIRFHSPSVTTTLYVAANRVFETITTLK